MAAAATAHHVLWGADGRQSNVNDASTGSWVSGPSSDSAAPLAARAASGRAPDDGSKPANFHVLHTSGNRSNNGAGFNACLRAAMVGATVVVDTSSGSGLRGLPSGGAETSASASFEHMSGEGPSPPTRARLGEAEPPQQQQQQPESQQQQRRRAGQAPSEDDLEECRAPTAGEERVLKEVLAASGGREDALVKALMDSKGPEIPGLAPFYSKGLALHAGGRCKPCHYIHTPAGCQNGLKCTYCHLPHMLNNPRPCKTKRQHYRRFQAMLETVMRDTPERFTAVLGAAGEECPGLKLLEDTWPTILRGEDLPSPLAPGLVPADGSKRRNIMSL